MLVDSPLIDVNGMRVIELAGRLRLPDETAYQLFITALLRVQEFDGNQLLILDVLGFVDSANAAFANEPYNPVVVPEYFPRLQPVRIASDAGECLIFISHRMPSDST